MRWCLGSAEDGAAELAAWLGLESAGTTAWTGGAERSRWLEDDGAARIEIRSMRPEIIWWLPQSRKGNG